MSRQSLRHASRPLSAALGIAAFVAAAGTGCSNAPSPGPGTGSAPAAAVASPPAGAAAAGPIDVPISAEARARAGIEVAVPIQRAVGSRLRLPGSIAPDAYGQVTALALVGGRVTTVSAELGTAVGKDQALATIFSTDVADAQATYLNHRAAVEADHQRVMRLERLVAIGADSRQTLDDARAMHTLHASELERAASRLKFFGFSDAEIDRLVSAGVVTSEYIVRAPAAGVVTKRDVNAGQTVSADTTVMQISRLDRVWVLASAYEQDAGRLRVNMPATVSIRGQSGPPLPSRIAYVDPQVDAATRTAQVRLELANPNQALRFGLLVDVEVAFPDVASALMVPSEAVQSVGEVQVVYVQDARRPDVLVETPVIVGTTEAGQSEIRRGLAATDRVVVRGASFVRAERLRIHPLTAGRF
jgi:RND family efflux transporter MFP subunit